MFLSLKAKLLVSLYIFLLISIPVGAYLASKTQIFKSQATSKSESSVKSSTKPVTSPAKELLSSSESKAKTSTGSSSVSEDDSSSPTIAKSFGPTLSLSARLEGRRDNDQSTKLFVGIVEGNLASNPKFLLSFTVDLPASGNFSNLSLAGLTSGTKYTALLKGSSQIATSSAFTMAPNVTNLNGGVPLNLLSGDLNEDNVINSADYNIALRSLGATPVSSGWNILADFNRDGLINSFDLSLVTKNLGKTGASGAWTSPIPTASSSASLAPAIGGPDQDSGYWIWIPR